ncbi:hypothetical protein FE257_002026 [Aspergillus nanangensis]|uniref:FAD dependent oxidoreductase domain-containing protein n=1 Tax=Aspergillus nanangensis TaxID=2582783 RepID=A0AAD4CT77_ASPNN|nr:hypothetical protein FE257_002026 [Aspergillus nanangensis]
MDKNSKIVIIGAGIFGLSTAAQLASEGHRNILVLDRHVPPVPDGSSSDISRVIRFDYADDDYLRIAHEAYLKWQQSAKYKGIFYSAPYILTGNTSEHGQSWIKKTTAALTQRNLPWQKIDDAAEAKKKYPVLSGALAGGSNFFGYDNQQAGWADASKAVSQLRDDCIELGVSFISGRAGTVVALDTDPNKKITAVRTLAGTSVEGDHFILTAGAWSAGLVPMYHSTLATAQAVGYVRLSESEMQKYADLPIYANFSTGWFNFPPHEESKMLKMAVHGWGYTRTPNREEQRAMGKHADSSPPMIPPRERRNFAPVEAEQRLRQGLCEILPELGDRPFDRVALCWYTDTPTGDFIMDFHPDYANLFIGGAGSGHAFKFLPVLGEYMSLALKKTLPSQLAQKWRFRKDYATQEDAFVGDGSRGGPIRRELHTQERAKL